MYILSKFVIALISPLGASLFLGAVAVLCALCKWRRFSLLLGLLALGWLWVWVVVGDPYIKEQVPFIGCGWLLVVAVRF